jgi:hypothetical protein
MHIHGSNEPDPKHDEAYDAFVKLYRDNSDIKSAYSEAPWKRHFSAASGSDLLSHTFRK